MPISDQDRDMMIRTIIGEASDQPTEGQAAVAHVILNRAKNGRYGGSSPTDVVLAPSQFEPWQTRSRELLAISPNSKQYQKIGQIVDGVLSGQIADPTNGASHFLDEAIVRQRRGGTLPSWARGQGMKIGDHTFYYPDAPMAPAQNRTVPMELGNRTLMGTSAPKTAMDAINVAIGANPTGDVKTAALPFTNETPPNGTIVDTPGGRFAYDAKSDRYVPAPNAKAPPAAPVSKQQKQDLLDLFDAPSQQQQTAPAATVNAPVVKGNPTQQRQNLLDLFDAPESQNTPAEPIVQPPTPQQSPTQVAEASAAQPGYVSGLVRSAAEGIPLLGALPNKLNALTYAAAAPVVPGDTTISQAPNFWQRYDENLKREQGTSRAFEQANPIASIAAGLTGGIAATLPVAGTTVGANMLGLIGKTIPQRMVAGAVSGAGLGAADAALRGQDAETGAATGAVLGAVSPAIGRAVGAGVNKLRGIVSGKPASIPTTDELGNIAEAGYDAIKKLDVRIKPNAVKTLAGDIENDLRTDGFRDYLAPKTFGVLEELSSPSSKQSYASFADLHGIRRALGKAASSSDPTERAAASRVMNSLDKYLENAPAKDVLRGDIRQATSIFKEAQGNYAAMKRAELLAGKIEKAENQAGSANSGQNIDNATRQRINDILKNEKLLRGFNDEEIEMMQRIVRGSKSANLLRFIGNKLGGGGGLGMLASEAVGGSAGLALQGYPGAAIGAAALPITGYAAKKAANALTQRSVNALDELIRSRAPASQSAVNANALAAALQQQRLDQAARLGGVVGRALIPPTVRYTQDGYPFYDRSAQ